MLSRVITKQHHETVLIQCLNAMVGITRSKAILFTCQPTDQFYHVIFFFTRLLFSIRRSTEYLDLDQRVVVMEVVVIVHVGM